MNLGYVLKSGSTITKEETDKVFEILSDSLSHVLKQFYNINRNILTRKVELPGPRERLTVITTGAPIDETNTLKGILAGLDTFAYSRLVQENLLREDRRYDFVIGSNVISDLDGIFVYARTFAQQGKAENFIKVQQDITEILSKYGLK